MSESTFRDNLAGFRWAQGNSGSAGASGSAASDGMFGRLTSGISGYIPLRSNARTNEEEAYLTLSRWERFVGFLFCCAGAAICFLVAFLTLPLLAIKPRKFAVAFSLGSLLFILGFVILQGPVAQAKHMVSAERLPFSAAYFGSLGLTLFFALHQQSYLGTLLCAIVQVMALVSYFVAYFPGGIQTLRMGGSLALRGASTLLPT